MSTHDRNVIGGPPPRFKDVDSSVSDRHSEIFFAAVETTRMPMIVTDPHVADHPIVFCNRAFSQMTGYSMAEIVGRNCRFLQGPETDRGSVNDVREAVREQREMATEILNYRKDGSSFWNALFVSPVFDRDGKLLYYFGSQLDVSRRRDAEDALRQAQKMEALGQLTGGIAHDFNNLLQVVVGYAEMAGTIASRLEETRLHRAIDQIKEAADRATTLTQQLLAFSRKQRLEGRVVNLNTIIGNMSEITARTTGDGITIGRRLLPDLWNTKVDSVQAEVALLNIVINARDAMGPHGTLTIETMNRTVAADDPDGFQDILPGRYAVVLITDTGEGMAPEVVKRVLDPFFTTKEEGKGTGLGLSMVYGFMKQSGGSVRIGSVRGEGTTISLLFPASNEALSPERTARVPRSTDRAREAEAILVVEDRPQVAELAVTVLTDYGYEVHSAESGREALALINGGLKVNMLFSDVVMPGGLNGIVLAREMRRLLPRLKVLLTSGFSENSLERQEAGGSEFDIISKPYKPTDLSRKVREVLDGPTGVG